MSGQRGLDQATIGGSDVVLREIAFEFEKLQADALQRTPRVRVVHGAEGDLSTLWLMKVGLHPRNVNEAFAADLQAACGTAPLSEADRTRVARTAALAEGRDVDAQLRSGRMRMWVSNAAAAGGRLRTWSYSGSSPRSASSPTCSRLPRRAPLMTATTSSASRRRLTRMASDLAGVLVDDVQAHETPAVGGLVELEVQRPRSRRLTLSSAAGPGEGGKEEGLEVRSTSDP